MPSLDRTGPRGEGPRTGGGFGNCLPNTASSQATASRPTRYGRGLGPCGRGLGRGRGAGRGRGRR